MTFEWHNVRRLYWTFAPSQLLRNSSCIPVPELQPPLELHQHGFEIPSGLLDTSLFYLPPHSESLHISPQWVDYAHWPIQKQLRLTRKLSREEFLQGDLLGAVWCSLSHWGTRLRVRSNLVLTVRLGVELCRKALFRISARNVIQISSAAVLFPVSGDTGSRPRWCLLASPRELSGPQVSPFSARGLACHCCSVSDSVLEILGAQSRASLVRNTKWSRWKGRTKKSSRVHPWCNCNTHAKVILWKLQMPPGLLFCLFRTPALPHLAGKVQLVLM